MVRFNLIKPRNLTDQHLIAEYNEILMFRGYLIKHPKLDGTEPKEYTLGKGHIKFFKDKLLYVSMRFDQLSVEMTCRGYKPKKSFRYNKNFTKNLYNIYKPTEKAFEIIKQRIISKIKAKPNYYTYYGKKLPDKLLIKKVIEDV